MFDELGLHRERELVRVLVPFAQKDIVYATKNVLILDPNGQETAVQWRVLQRWRGAPDNVQRPLRFALASFQVDLPPGGDSQVFTLRRRVAADGPPAVPEHPIQAWVQGAAAVIDTGPIRVGFDPRQHQLFTFANADLDGDGVASDAERVLEPDSVGALLVDSLDGVYLGVLDSQLEWEVEEAGPLRLVIRVDGRHLPNFGGIGRDYFRFATRYTFEAGSATVRVEHVLENTYLEDPLGAMTFARYLLHSRLAGTAPIQVTFGTEEGVGVPYPIDLGKMESAFVYQDSSGKSQWNQPGTTFKGWRLYHGGPFTNPVRPEDLPRDKELAWGDHSAGWMDVSDGDRGMLVGLRYPWQNYPFALRAYQTRDVVADLWPAEFAGTHWLDDATRKAHHLVYTFHGPTFDPAAEALRATRPLLPVVDLTYLRYTKAWADQGDLRDPGLPFWKMKQYGDQKLGEFYIFANVTGGFGWNDFGENAGAKNTHATGSPRNKLSYFERFMVSGARSWFEMQEAFALHSMDLRTYHIDGFTQQSHPGAHLVEGIPHWTGSDMLGRDQIPASLAPYKVGIPSGGHGWNGYDTEHMSVDDLYEYYLLTGSFAALDALKKIGEGMKTWHIINPSLPIVSSRAIGWSLRALVKIHQVTGDPVILDKAKDLVQIVHNFRGADPSPKNGVTYHYLARNIYGGGTHGMTDDYDLPWQIAAGMHGLALYHRETLDPTVPPVLDDLSRYIAQFCVVNGVVVDALACDDHKDNNPKGKNDGVNTWIPSALAIAYRLTANPLVLDLGAKMFHDNKTEFLDSPSYSWFHSIGEVLEGTQSSTAPDDGADEAFAPPSGSGAAGG